VSQYGAYALHAALARLHAHTDKYVICIAFPQQQFANTPQCYIVHTLPVFFSLGMTLLQDYFSWHGIIFISPLQSNVVLSLTVYTLMYPYISISALSFPVSSGCLWH
jgi:hypothetical protein